MLYMNPNKSVIHVLSSLNSHQDVSPDLPSSISLKEVACLDNVVQEDAGDEDIVPKGAEKDGDMPKDKDSAAGKKTQQTSSSEEDTVEGQMLGLNGETEKLASLTSSQLPVVLVTQQDDLSGEEGVGNRFVHNVNSTCLHG